LNVLRAAALQEGRKMTSIECAILGFFRRYQIMPNEMLFFNPHDCKIAPTAFDTAMRSLVDRGLVAKERAKQAYSLTEQGYDLSLAIDEH
jgi:RIO-like serine/threonine protein kinase